jgi:hypothetical protein
VAFDVHRAMLNLRLRERSWDEICTSAPLESDDNFVADPQEPLSPDPPIGFR